MKLSKIILGSIFGALGFFVSKKVLSRYKLGIYYFDKNDPEMEDDMDIDAMDLRGTPTHSCICGSEVFYVKTVFDNYEIGTYFLDMICAECGSLATAPTLLDKEKME